MSKHQLKMKKKFFLRAPLALQNKEAFAKLLSWRLIKDNWHNSYYPIKLNIILTKIHNKEAYYMHSIS